jgi:GTP-binding protein
VAILREEPEGADGSVEPGRTVTLSGSVTSLTTARGIERVDIEEAGPGDIVALAGIPEVTIGDTITDPADPRPLPRLDVDTPTLRMTLGVNTSPLSGREGKYVTSRQIKARLDKEVFGNVSIEVYATETGDTFEVRGRGELQLAVLIETMRREGFELQVSKPTVIVRGREGIVEEPVELLVVDSPEDYVGVVTQLLGVRRGIMAKIDHTGGGRVRMEFRVPSRGLIGFRSHFLTETRGTATMNTLFDGWAPWHGAIPARTNGAMVSDREGTATPYALFHLQDRGVLFTPAGTAVYEGMVVGEYSRDVDLEVNVCREKKLTNMRASGHDEAVRLVPHREMGLEDALAWIDDDELVEVTPGTVRIRKRELRSAFRPRGMRSNRPAGPPPVTVAR